MLPFEGAFDALLRDPEWACGHIPLRRSPRLGQMALGDTTVGSTPHSYGSHRGRVPCDNGITGEQRDPLNERLGDQNTVERVFV